MKFANPLIAHSMEFRHTPRLYMETGLGEGVVLELRAERAHYLLNVLRLKAGATVRLFNAQDGEWRASVTALAKKSLTFVIGSQLRAPRQEPDLWLCAAPIKKAHFEYMIEKATELGVAMIQPVLTARTQIREVNLERARSIAIEAAEQSERLGIPDIRPPLTLEKLAAGWDAARTLIVCAEWGEARPLAEALAAAQGDKAGIFTGPEGGLAADELDFLRARREAVFVRLGPRILRADTAAIAALAGWQSLCGDWRKSDGT